MIDCNKLMIIYHKNVQQSTPYLTIIQITLVYISRYFIKMSVSFNNMQDNLSSDIKNFIGLLQNSSFNEKQLSREPSNHSQKLSIIYSVPEIQSSVDKDSRNFSNNFSSPTELLQIIQSLFEKIYTFPLVEQQQRILQTIQEYIAEVRSKFSIIDVLLKEREDQATQLRNMNENLGRQLHDFLEHKNKMQLENKTLKQKIKKMQKEASSYESTMKELLEKLQQYNRDVEFMKRLVLVANENYEKIEIKCKKLAQEKKILENFKERQNSPQITSRSSKNHQISKFSPSIEKLSCSFIKTEKEKQKSYRAQVVRNLKNRAFR